ncbi:hypothetical protein CSW64_05965 [Caulobacter mirabilis]|uniref:Uncharacterized protein n=2 Tax=Caulobacter mirabilis TaxID=69666 RepID=A0A2D2AVF0_9CAUL|nr:hypothetical protein CSW64_05965 [Caulobacter mirabilis]
MAAFAAALTGASPVATSVPQASRPGDVAEMTLGYTYYNRPGATPASHDADVALCWGEAAKTVSNDELFTAGAGDRPTEGVMVRALVTNYQRSVTGAALENCMVVRGWRVVLIGEAEGRNLAALSQEEVADWLEGRVGAETPDGDIVRVWENDIARRSSRRAEFRPGHKNDGQLSLLAATGKVLADVTPVRSPMQPMSARGRKSLKPEQIASVPEGAAILVVRVANSLKDGGWLLFTRRDGSGSGPPPVDRPLDAALVGVGKTYSKSSGWTIVAVPPGRWEITQLAGINLCLGAPAFEVKPGEVVYAGAFDFTADRLGPDLSLEPVGEMLGGRFPASLVRPAVYSNGWRGHCGDASIYAFEVPDAPFAPGYVWGGNHPSSSADPAGTR